eukprot:scaffold236064_cov51-Attheya_sp.AAC.3
MMKLCELSFMTCAQPLLVRAIQPNKIFDNYVNSITQPNHGKSPAGDHTTYQHGLQREEELLICHQTCHFGAPSYKDTLWRGNNSGLYWRGSAGWRETKYEARGHYDVVKNGQLLQNSNWLWAGIGERKSFE